jgi:uncharacterized membrane protein
MAGAVVAVASGAMVGSTGAAVAGAAVGVAAGVHDERIIVARTSKDTNVSSFFLFISFFFLQCERVSGISSVGNE